MINVNAQKYGKITVLNLNGELNMDNVDTLEGTFNNHVNDKPEVVCINCKNLNSIDSSGLGIFIKLLRIAESRDIELVVTEIIGNVSSLFDISKLESFFSVMSESEFKKQYLP